MATLQCKTNVPEGRFRSLGDKGRNMVTRGRTKGNSIFFRDSLKKSFDILPAPSIFHFIQVHLSRIR